MISWCNCEKCIEFRKNVERTVEALDHAYEKREALRKAGVSAEKSKYDWCTEDAKSEKQFLSWIWARLIAKGDAIADPHMQRLDSIISKAPGNMRIDVTDDRPCDIYRKGKLIHSD